MQYTLNIQATKATGNAIILRGNLTGTGTLLHDQGYKLILMGDNTGFSGRVKSTAGRYIEAYRGSSTSGNAIYELNGAQGIAFCADGNETYRLGALIGNNAATPMTVSSVASGNVTLEVGNSSTLVADSDNIFAGQFSDNGTTHQTLSLSKVGTGMWTLTGNSTHTGDTTVKAGTLNIASSANLSGSKIVVEDDGTLRLEGTIKALELNGTLEIDFTDGTRNDIAVITEDIFVGGQAGVSLLTGDMTFDDMLNASYKIEANNMTTATSQKLAEMVNAAIAESAFGDQLVYNIADGRFITAQPGGAGVPEPATWVLLVFGVLGLGYLSPAHHKESLSHRETIEKRQL